jgi:hypothetical protein
MYFAQWLFETDWRVAGLRHQYGGLMIAPAKEGGYLQWDTTRTTGQDVRVQVRGVISLAHKASTMVPAVRRLISIVG